MRPVTFDGCAGVLYPGWADRGVVILGTLGSEGNIVHRGLHELASVLSEDGCPVLRYDFPGTGQSGGDLESDDLLEHWIASVGGAVECLRRCSGVQRIDLVGIRLGASVALLAQEAELCDADRIVSIAPVVRGRTYVRELRMLSAARTKDGGDDAQAPRRGIDLAGEIVPERLAADLAGIDLRRLRRCGSEVLLIDADRPDAALLADRLRLLGVRTVRRGFADGPAFLCDALDSMAPTGTFEAIRAWLGSAPLSGSERRTVIHSAVEANFLEDERWVEHHLSFGRDPRLHGVLTLPRRPPMRRDVLLFVNTGLTRSSGDGRITVTLARALAVRGVASLRMDVAGIGDSGSRPERSREVLYDRAAVEDVGEAIDLLQARGFGGVVLVGTCSGAYLALQSALADTRVRSVVAVNLQRFVWRDGMSVRIDRSRSHRTMRSYLRELRRAEGWRRAARDWRRVLAIVSGAAERAWARAARLARDRFGAGLDPTDPRNEARMMLSTLSSRGQRVTLVYSEDDPGWAELTALFGRRGRDLRHLAGIAVRTIAGADHILTGADARAALCEMVAAEAALLAVEGRGAIAMPEDHRHAPEAGSRREVALAG